MRPDRETTAALEGWLRGTAPATSEFDPLWEEVRRRVHATRQQERRPSPAWRMRSMALPGAGRVPRVLTGAVGLVASVVVVSAFGGYLLVMGPPWEPTGEPLPGAIASATPPSSPLPSRVGDRRTIVVAKDGSGDTTTIAQALELADDGATVIVRPGLYRESLAITEDVELRGEGQPGEVVIGYPNPGSIDDYGQFTPVVIELIDTTAQVADLTVVDGAIEVKGGSPTLERLVVDLPGLDLRHAYHHAVSIGGGSSAIVRASVMDGNVIVDGGAAVSILDNEIAAGVEVGSGSTLVEGNDITFPDHEAVRLTGDSGEPIIRDNVIHDSETGIAIDGSDRATVDSNRVTGNSFGIVISGSARPTVSGNSIKENAIGIQLSSDGSPTIEGNTVEQNQVGLLVEASGSVLSGNTVCGNIADLRATAALVPSLDGTVACTDAVGLVAGPTQVEDLITVPVEPGVERVISDGQGHDFHRGARELRGGMGQLVSVDVSADGTVMITNALGPDSGFDMWVLGRPVADHVGPIDSPLAVSTAPDGSAWLAGFGRYLARFDGGSWTVLSPGARYARQLDAAQGVYLSHAVDRDGTVWAAWGLEHDEATEAPVGGPWSSFGRFDGSTWTEIDETLLTERVNAFPKSVVAAPDGRILFGFGDLPGPGGGGIVHFDGASWQQDPLRIDGLTPGVLAMATAPDGSLWAYLEDDRYTSTWSDPAAPRYVAHLLRGSWTVYSSEDGVPEAAAGEPIAPPMAVGADGAVWLAGAEEDPGRGLLAFRDGRVTRYLVDHRVSDIAIAPDGTVWAIGTLMEPARADGNPSSVLVIRP